MNSQLLPIAPDPGRARLAAQLRALAHPARLAVLETLARQESCMCGEIVRGLPLAQSTVSQHIKILAEAGLVRASVSGSRTCYCIDKAALAALRDDVQTLFEGFRLGAADPSEGVPAVAAGSEVGIHD